MIQTPEEPIRILHLEDDPVDAELLRATLEADGIACRIDVVSSGPAFTDTLAANPYDLIVADYQVPGFDGIAAQQIAAEQAPAVPFIFLSGTLGEETAVERMKAGATDYVVKGRIGRMPVAVRRALAEAGERRRRAVAESANRAKSEFLSRMSHDLRTPLNAIIGFAQLLELEGVPPSQQAAVEQILAGARHLLVLITEILEIMRIETGNLPLSSDSVAATEAVQSIAALTRPLALERGISVRVDLPDRPVFLKADRSRVSQVLLNLLSNAIKYNREGGEITIAVSQAEPGRGRIAVSDQGQGIPESKLHLLFTPFQRLGAERSGIEGTGLGLAVSRGIVETMGGTMGVSSRMGEGSTFWIELPIDPDGVAKPRAAARAARRQLADIATQGSVVYIEDNPSNVKLLENLLRRRPNVRLTSFGTGREGLASMRRDRPHLLLLDRHLPDMTGDEVLRHLAADPHTASIPVVMLTADAMQTAGPELEADNLRAYLTKPLDVVELLQLVDRFLPRTL